MRDIFKKSFLDGYASADITVVSVVSAMAVTLILGIYIFLAYRVITKKTFYSKNFNISLVGVSLITAAIIVTIQSSIVVSLGMVGALSIVRFRTAIKEPLDLMFLFWSISVGIICGAGFASYAVVLCVVLTVALLVLDKVPVAKAPLILVVNSSDADIELSVLDIVGQYDKHYCVKSRNVSTAGVNLTIELRTAQGRELVSEVVKLNHISGASLLSHDGEVCF